MGLSADDWRFCGLRALPNLQIYLHPFGGACNSHSLRSAADISNLGRISRSEIAAPEEERIIRTTCGVWPCIGFSCRFSYRDIAEQIQSCPRSDRVRPEAAENTGPPHLPSQ